MKLIFSKSQVPFCLFGLLSMLIMACSTLSTDPVQAEDLSLQPTEVQEAPVSTSAEAMAYFGLGLNRELEKDYPGAIEAFQQAIRKDPENDMLYMIASQRLIQADRTDDAFALLEKLLQIQPENVTARRWLAKLYLREGKPEQAREQLALAIKEHPASEQIYLEAIQLALQAKELPEVLALAREANQVAEHPIKCTEILIKLLINEQKQAEDVKGMLALQQELETTLEKAIVHFPETEIFSMIRADLDIEKNQWQAAFASYKELDDRFKGSAEIRIKILANILRNSGGGARGVRTVEQQIQELPESRLNFYLLGLIKEMTRQPAEALQAYEKAVELDPEDLEALQKQAVLTYQTGQTLRATELIDQILDKNHDDPEILMLAGQLSLGSEAYTQAKTYFERCLLRGRQGEEIEDLPFVYTQLAMSLLASMAEPQVVEDAMVKASTTPGNLEWIWQFYMRKIDTIKQDNPPDAEKMQTDLIRLLEDLSDRLPENPEVEWLIGRSQADLKNFLLAVKAYERCEALAKESSQPDLWLNDTFYFDMAAAYERAGKNEQSVAIFEKIIKQTPDHHPSLNYLAYMWAEQNQNLDQALAYIQKALQLDPENGSYLDTLGWVYYKKGNFKAAYRELAKAAELIPEESVVAEHLGDVLMKMSRSWEAMGYYKIALLLDPAERNDEVLQSLHNSEIAVSSAVKTDSASPN